MKKKKAIPGVIDVIDAQAKLNVVLASFEHPEYFTAEYNRRTELKEVYKLLENFMIKNNIA